MTVKVPKTTKGFQLTQLDPTNLEIHELANNNPMMPEDQYLEFIEKFKNGFDRNVSHIVIYKGKVVDGRHRVRVCKELGIKLWARNLPSTMPIEQVEEFVDNTENRRHQTATQRAIGAYKYYRAMASTDNPVSQTYAATKKLSNRKHLARAGKLAELIGDELLNKLHDGAKLKVVNPTTGLPTLTDALIPLINYFTNRNEELVVTTKVNSQLTDTELELAKAKFDDLQLECNRLVLKQIHTLIEQSLGKNEFKIEN